MLSPAKIKNLKLPLAALSIFMALAVILTGSVSAESQAIKYSEDKRFIDNGDKTVTDTKTGLQWMQEDSYQYKGHWLNWFQASKYIDELNQERFADYLDWRLTTLKELTTLYEEEKFNGKQVGFSTFTKAPVTHRP